MIDKEEKPDFSPILIICPSLCFFLYLSSCLLTFLHSAFKRLNHI